MSGEHVGELMVGRQQGTASEPPRGYAVISETDESGQVWHYPVRSLALVRPSAPGAALGAAHAAGEQWTPVYFMAPAGPVKRQQPQRQPQRQAQRRVAIRFKSRARAVRFTQDDAAAERDLLRELQAAFG